MTTVLNGVIGGVVAAVLAAVLAAGLARLLASERQGAATATTAGGDDGRWSRWRTLGLVVAYGGVAGGALVALDFAVFDVLGVPPSAVEAFGAAVLWSAVLCAGALAAGRLVSNRPAIATVRRVVLFHALYGLALGLWIRLTWIT